MFAKNNQIDSNEEWSNYESFIKEDVIRCKDGTFLAMFRVSASDWQSSSPSERDNQRMSFARAVKKMGTGWSLQSSLCRAESSAYTPPSETNFPNYLGFVIDNEVRRRYERGGEGADSSLPYEQDLYYSVGFTNSTFSKENIKKMMLSVDDAHVENALEAEIKVFESGLSTIVESVERGNLFLSRLGMLVDEVDDEFIVKSEMLGVLRGFFTGKFDPVIIFDPAAVPDLSKFVLSEPISIGSAEVISNDSEGKKRRYRIVEVQGFPFSLEKQAQRCIQNLALPLVWSSRFIALDSNDAKKVLDVYSNTYKTSKINPFKRAVSKEWSEKDINLADKDGEIYFKSVLNKEVDSGNVGIGFYTSIIMVWGESQGEVDDRATLVKKTLENVGFVATVEEVMTINGVMATLPGNHYHMSDKQPTTIGTEDGPKPMRERYRQKQHLGTSVHAASLFPSTGTWSGEKYHPSDQYPKKSPPLMFLDTAGNAPHRLTTFVEDVGHTSLYGQTGSGKSTLLNQMCVFQLKYEKSLVIVLDKKYSFFTSCALMGGDYFDMTKAGSGDANAPKFSPLSRIDDPAEREWLVSWFELIAQIGGIKVTAAVNTQIRGMLNNANKNGHRNMTEMLTAARIPSELSEVFVKLTAGSSMLGDLLDGDGREFSSDKRMLCFAMDTFFSSSAMSSEVVPLAYYIFHFFQQLLDGRPAMVVIDEGHNLLREPDNKSQRVTFDFGVELEKFLLEMRSLNGFLLFATQNISAVASASLSIRTALIQSTASRIYLADKAANEKEQSDMYKNVGLSDFEINIIAQANMRRDMLIIKKAQNDSSVSAIEPKRRLSTNTLDQFSLSCVGVTDKKLVVGEVMPLIERYGNDPFNWHSRFCVSRGLFKNIDDYRFYIEHALGEIVKADQRAGYMNDWDSLFQLGN